jgi:ribosomal-protein-alanine N-acetyltransferase
MSDIFTKFPIIDLGETILRELKVEDAKKFLGYMKNKNISKYTSDDEVPVSILAAEGDLLYWKNLFSYRRSIYWAIANKNNDEMIGSCGFNYWNKQHGRLEISYDLNYKFWGKGIITKSVTAITDLILKESSAQRVQATVATDNERSIKVLERCNYKKEGVLASYFNLRGIKKDAFMYSRTQK